jgi:hypothetical protein
MDFSAAHYLYPQFWPISSFQPSRPTPIFHVFTPHQAGPNRPLGLLSWAQASPPEGSCPSSVRSEPPPPLPVPPRHEPPLADLLCAREAKLICCPTAFTSPIESVLPHCLPFPRSIFETVGQSKTPPMLATASLHSLLLSKLAYKRHPTHHKFSPFPFPHNFPLLYASYHPTPRKDSPSFCSVSAPPLPIGAACKDP